MKNGILKSYEQHSFGFYLLELKESKQAIGICGLIKRDELDDIEIGFGFLPEYEGKGYGFESAKAVMDYSSFNLGIKRLIAITDPANLKSIKLLEKLKMKFEKTILFGKQKEKTNLYGIDWTD